GRNMITNKHWIRESNYEIKKSIIELEKLKELELELIKIKGHSSNKWNNRVDSLAKEGSKIIDLDRIILKPPPSLNVSLKWQESQIEDPTREFIKNIMDLRIGGQCGVRCTSMAKNRKLATLIKCMNGKLPLMKTLARRCPDLYDNPYCICCKSEQEEDQLHLAKCEKRKADWDIVE
ncbi:26134_t:CDS:2, partial [Gigaspora margarita]